MAHTVRTLISIVEFHVYTRYIKSANLGPKVIHHVLDLIREGVAVRSAAKDTVITIITWCSLMRYKKQKTVRDIPGKVMENQIFTRGEEVQLQQYLEMSLAIYYVFSETQTHR